MTHADLRRKRILAAPEPSRGGTNQRFNDLTIQPPNPMPRPSSSLHPLPRQTKPAARPASPSKPRRRRSLIASLPKSVRDQINGFLREGLTYAQVIARLGDSGKLLNTDHIEHWFAGGYQDWLKEQHWLEQMRQKLDFACDILKDTEAGKIHEASLRIVVKQ